VLLLFQASPASAGALERAMLGKSAIVDLSHPSIECPSPAEPPPAGTAGENRTARDDCGTPGRDFQTRLTLQPGPRSDTRSVAQVAPRELLASAVVVSVAQKSSQSPEYQVTLDDLRAWERKHGRIPKQTVVLMNTGWAVRWKDPGRYANVDASGAPQVPGVSPAAAAFLVDERQVRGLGLDVFVPERAPARRLIPAAPTGLWWLENLDSLDRLPARGVKLIIAPLRVEAVSVPARVIAILP
jgi:kynurenine formamidase